MKILIIDGSQNPPTFIKNLIEGLLTADVDVTLLGKRTARDFKPLSKRKMGVVITNYSRWNGFFQVFQFAYYALFHPVAFWRARDYVVGISPFKLYFKQWIIHAKILLTSPDIIHFQWATHIEAYKNLIESHRFKIVVSLRGRQINVSPVVDSAIGALYSKFFPAINGFHAVSRSIARLAVANGADTRNVHVIHSPVPEMFINAFNEQDNFGNEPFRIVSVGRFSWAKGYKWAIDAMAVLKRKHVAFSYTIIAPGELPDEIVYQVKDLSLNNEITIINGVDYNRMVLELKKYSVLLLPSVTEGIANVVLEAMAVGLPVVSTDCGGMGEVVVHNETGVLIKPMDENAIVEGLMAARNVDAISQRRMRKQGWQKVKDNFTQRVQIGEFIRLYQSLT